MRTITSAAKRALLALALLAPAGVWAADMSGVSFGPRAVFFDPKDADEGKWFGGAQLRFYGDFLGLEGSVDYRKDEFFNDTVEVITWPVQASLLGFLGDSDMAIRPYLLAGGGWYFTTVEVDALNQDETDNRFGVHAGAGLQAMLSPVMSISADYRYVWLEKLKTQDAALQDKEFKDSGSQITAALNFHF